MTPQPLPQPIQLSPEHLAELQASGLTEAQAAATGHRTVDAQEAKRLTGHDLPGLLFTYLDPTTNRPYQILTGKWAKRPFCRLKPDWDNARPSQREFYADEDGKLPKYLSPKDCGSRPYFSQLLDWSRIIQKNTPITITEGEKKGDSGCAIGLPTISLSGVSAFVDRDDRDEWQSGDGSSWDVSEPEEDKPSRFLPELEQVNWKHRPVGICFDSDVVTKIQVQKSLERLLSHIRARTGKGIPIILPNELDGSKNGMDDFIARHGVDAFCKLWDAFHSIQESSLSMVQYKKEDRGGTKVFPGEVPDKEGRVLRCFFTLKEPPTHVKALMTWAVLKEDWAYRPGLGWYRWNGKHWAIAGDAMEMGAEIAKFFDAQNWQNRNGGQYSYTQDEMARRTIIPEEIWGSETKISFNNGTLDTATNQFHPHRRGDYCTAILPYDYDPFAQCPHWLQFINSATGGDFQLQQLMRAWFRWILQPKDRRYKFPVEKSLDLIGRKGSGKGTFLDVLTLLIGEDNCASASPDSFSSPEGLGQMIDKRIAIDADASGYMPGVGNFNKVVSNEAVSVKKLFKDKATVRLGIIVVRSYNDFVSVPSSGTEGLDRRLCILPFRHPPKSPDYTLSDKLKEELPGVFAWAWSMPLASAKAVIQWSGSIRAVQDASIDRFCSDHPEFRFLLDEFPAGHDSIQAYDLYSRYTEWAKRNGHKACSNTKFGTLMNELNIHHHKGNGGAVFYRIPHMEKEFDIVEYLRISPGDPSALPLELRETVSQPDTKNAEGSEGCGGLKISQEQDPVCISEGSEGLEPDSFYARESPQPKPPQWIPTGKAIAVGDMTEANGSAQFFRRGSFTIKDSQLLSKYRLPDAAIPLLALPDWAYEQIGRGPWPVEGISPDGQRAKLRLNNGKLAVIGIEGLYAVQKA